MANQPDGRGFPLMRIALRKQYRESNDKASRFALLVTVILIFLTIETSSMSKKIDVFEGDPENLPVKNAQSIGTKSFLRPNQFPTTTLATETTAPATTAIVQPTPGTTGPTTTAAVQSTDGKINTPESAGTTDPIGTKPYSVDLERVHVEPAPFALTKGKIIKLDGTSRPKYKCLPSFIINGVQKGGTTELAQWLQNHPHLARYQGWENHFWDCLAESPGNWRSVCFTKPWRKQKIEIAIEKFDAYSPILGEREASDPNYQCFEKTPSYFDLVDPRQIEMTMPNLKIVTSLRNPSARFYSGYWQTCKTTKGLSCSKEKFLSKVQSLKQEMYNAGETCMEWQPKERGNKVDNEFDRLFGNGRYALLLPDWYKVFGDRLLILHFESFVKDPFMVLNEIQDHVNIPRFDFKAIGAINDQGYWDLYSSRHNPQIKQYPSLTPEEKELVVDLYKPCDIALCSVLKQLSQSQLPPYLEGLC